MNLSLKTIQTQIQASQCKPRQQEEQVHRGNQKKKSTKGESQARVIPQRSTE